MDDKAIECVKLGVRARNAQKAFFREKTDFWLRESKKLEREWDDMAKYVIALHEAPAPKPSS